MLAAAETELGGIAAAATFFDSCVTPTCSVVCEAMVSLDAEGTETGS